MSDRSAVLTVLVCGMENRATTAPEDERYSEICKQKGRNKVSNGAKLLPFTDGRLAGARRFKDLCADISADLGGVDHLSEAQRQLVRRASLLSAESERLEAQWARNDKTFNVAEYAMLANCLRRICETIGLQRVARPVDGPLT